MTRSLPTFVVRAALLLSVPACAVAAQGVPLPDDLLIKLERTACFGSCPVYSVTIDAKGNVTYEGSRFVRVAGRQTDRIPVSRVAALLETAERIHFFELPDRYHASITDNPTTFVTVKYGGRSKRIEDYVAGPAELKAFQRLIDETARTKRWISLDEGMLHQMIRDGWTPPDKEKSARLKAALQEDDVAVLKALLDLGADPNATSDGGPPLMFVRSAAAARALLEAGANPFVTESYGTPLGRSAQLPSEVAEVLLKAGVPVDQPIGADGMTPLWSAACQGNAGVVAVLLRAGANPRVTVREMSPLDCAREAKASDRGPRLAERGVPHLRDFNGVIAILEQALARRKEP